jgi:4-amino-4-deoxy-L-arabinose transferase-like glycosyltransferase
VIRKAKFDHKEVGLQLEKRIRGTVARLQVSIDQQAGLVQRAAVAAGVVLALFLALYNLPDYPLTWFDEGSHLHVPKTLVRFGVYADYSSEGFRHYGPTLGIGPTVVLPIAAVFRLFGIGLLQARLVMALYLLATVYAFYRLARTLSGRRFAWVATGLLVTSRGVALVLYGRQALGEVPGLFFLVAGLGLWFTKWERSSWWRLGLVGLCLGLAVVTEYQYLLFLAPTLALAWLVNLVYYRIAPQRVFVLPGLIAAGCFALWQIYMILYLGPATATENLANLRQFTAGAALTFSPYLMEESLKVLMSFPNYLGSLLPVLIYGFLLALPRRREGQQWGIVVVLVAVNLGWYVVASIGWWRYAFLGLAMASLFVARFFHDLTDGFRLSSAALQEDWRRARVTLRNRALRWVMIAWLAAMLVVPLGETVWEILSPGFNAPEAMAAYLNEHIPLDALIETWEPEMGFLTDHNYHFPPAMLLLDAVQQTHLGGPPVTQTYHFVQTEHPDYVLVGDFARSVGTYPPDLLAMSYELVATVGNYELYARKGGGGSFLIRPISSHVKSSEKEVFDR